MFSTKSFIQIFHDFIEDRFSSKFELSDQKEVGASKIAKDMIFRFDIDNTDQKMYYFIDQKFARNLFSSMIDEIENPEADDNLTFRVIEILNNKILEKLNNDFKTIHSIKNTKLIEDNQSEFSNDNQLLLTSYLSSIKGSIFIAFTNQLIIKKDNIENNRKSQGVFLPNQIIQIKEKKDESSLLSAVQLIEIKKQVLTSINEIKDLKGDPDFLLRKAKTVSELTRLWLDIAKEEN